MRPVLANLGFVLQIGGFFIILPILVAFYYNEIGPLISFFITSMTFLCFGFLLNALCERKELDFKSSCILVTIVFFLLGIIGSIPYFYNNIFNDTDYILRLVNSYFESISGYSTTGLTFLADVDSLPRSIIFYRSLTQWIGGIGIVFIILAFFYSGNALDKLSRAIGFERVTSEIKRSFADVLLIYTFYAIIFIGIFYFLGLTDLINNISMVFSTIATGGFSPVTNFSELIPFPNNFVLNVLMLIGATSFTIHYRLLTGKIRSALTTEFLGLSIIIIISTFLLTNFVNLDITTAFFHAMSASTTTGYSFISFKNLNETGKMIFIILMFLGGMTFSTAGGVKILRLILFFKSIPWAIKRLITGTYQKFVFENKEFTDIDILHHLFVILLAGFLIFVSAFIFSFYGFSLIDAVFELSSAFATTGYSVGITNISLPIALKLILTFVMVMGRIEIIPFLVALCPIKETKIT
jgi:trk system potassium uptake protein TrkH